jgi:hypothetical protein
MLLSLTDVRWGSYRSGYNRRPYHSVQLIQHLQQHGLTDWMWDQLWGELHHQGDVGEASYAVLPYLVEHVRGLSSIDAQTVAYACVVEECRRNEHGQGNPAVPAEVLPSYEAALRELPVIALSKIPESWSEDLLRYVASLIALTHGQPKLAEAYQDFTAAEAERWLKTFYDAPL